MVVNLQNALGIRELAERDAIDLAGTRELQ